MFPFSKEKTFELGEAYFRHGDAARAIPEYEAALALDRNYAAALNHLGYCFSYLGRHRQAIECFERYRDIDRTANSFDSLGDGYFYMGDYIQAENSKIYAVSLDSSMDWPYLTVADIAILRADFSEAEKNLLRYQELASYPKAQADALAKKAFMRYLDDDPAAALPLARAGPAPARLRLHQRAQRGKPLADRPLPRRPGRPAGGTGGTALAAGAARPLPPDGRQFRRRPEILPASGSPHRRGGKALGQGRKTASRNCWP